MKSFPIISILLTILILGCVTGEQVRSSIQEGMSKDELTNQLGKPDGFKRVEDYTIYTYTNRLISGWSWDRTDYYFVFKGDELYEYGTGEVRVHQSNTGVIMFVPIIN